MLSVALLLFWHPAYCSGEFDEGMLSGFVWRVEGGRSHVYIAGSLHMLSKSDFPLPRSYAKAFEQCDHIVFETVPDSDQQRVQKFWQTCGVLPEGETIRDRLDRDSYLKLIDFLSREDGAVLTQLEKLEPWRASLLLTQRNFERLGLSSDLGIDRHFAKLAAEQGKSVAALENIELQLEPLAQWDKQGQVEMLMDSIDSSPKLPTYVKRLRALLRSGSEVEYERLREDLFPTSEETRRALYQKRHAVWEKKLIKLTEREKPSMVIVGIDHLVGETDNIISEMTGLGFKVSRVRTDLGPLTVPEKEELSAVEQATLPGAAARFPRGPSVIGARTYYFPSESE